MQIEDFKAVVRKYPEKRVVLYSLSTYQVVPNGEIKGSSYKDDEAESQSLYILYDETNDHFTAIVYMQAFCRSLLTHRDELFCDKCLGWISKWKVFTHL